MMHVGSVEEDQVSDDVSGIAEFDGDEVNKVSFVQVSGVICNRSNNILELYSTEGGTYSPTNKQVGNTDSK